MSDSVANILDKYRVAPKVDATQPQPSSGKLAYHAIGADAPRSKMARLMIYYHDETVGLMAYAYLMEVISTSHQYVSLIFTNCIITLEGKNLTGLMDKLQDERVVYLQCFHRERFEKPEEGEPIITRIERKGLQEFDLGRAKGKHT